MHESVATKHDLALLRAELRADMAKLESNLEGKIAAGTRQMYTAVLGQLAVLLGFTYFFATHLR